MAENRPAKRNSSFRKLVFTVFGFALSGIALYLVFRDFEAEKLLTYTGRIKILPLVASIILFWGGIGGIRAFLIPHLLRSVGEVRPGIAYRYIWIGFLANNILPLRMGEGARIVGIAKRSNISVVATAGSLLVERLLDLFMAAVVGIIAILLVPLPSGYRIGILVSGGVLMAVLVILGLVARRGLKQTSSSRYGRLIGWVWNQIARFSTGMNALGSTRSAIKAMVLMGAIWAVALLALLLRLVAFDLPPSLSTTMVLLASIGLAVAIPSAPSGLGVYHGLAAAALVLMGTEKDLALGFAFFNHFFDFASSSALGAVYMVMEGVGWSDLRAGAPAENDPA